MERPKTSLENDGMTHNDSMTIQDQVKLPINVAFQVVLQGIKIRFGRSLVTIMGVVLGIAFLMAILTGQIIKSGVGEEDAIRVEVRRMHSFLAAEMGPAEGREIALVLAGPMNEQESRLFARLDQESLKTVHLVNLGGTPFAAELRTTEIKTTTIPSIPSSVVAIIVGGEGSLDSGQWGELLTAANGRNICLSRKVAPESNPPASSFVALARELQAEEIKKIEDDARKARFRNIWIVIISLFVTVIGISNAMLMSVTERFREIGTMKCLGALSKFIRTIFLIEASIMGVAGAVAGCLIGVLFSIIAYAFVYGFGLTFGSLAPGMLLGYAFFAISAGIILSIVAAIYPANVASHMVPADALRSNI
jgi:ABC-type antimicrobial peptide transport system permease subunit